MAPALEAQGTPKKVRVVGVPIDEKVEVVPLPAASEFATRVEQTIYYVHHEFYEICQG